MTLRCVKNVREILKIVSCTVEPCAHIKGFTLKVPQRQRDLAGFSIVSDKKRRFGVPWGFPELTLGSTLKDTRRPGLRNALCAIFCSYFAAYRLNPNSYKDAFASVFLWHPMSFFCLAVYVGTREHAARETTHTRCLSSNSQPCYLFPSDKNHMQLGIDSTLSCSPVR